MEPQIHGTMGRLDILHKYLEMEGHHLEKVLNTSTVDFERGTAAHPRVTTLPCPKIAARQRRHLHSL
jgi:hypothetical protein